MSSNPPMHFPCLDKLDKKSKSLVDEGPEPVYARVQSGFEMYRSEKPLFLDYGGYLPEFNIAYETWGKLNSDKSNAILLHTGLSASSHAKSQAKNLKPGWWEAFIGPNKPLDTNNFFIICTNVIGGCYGSTGPSSIDPSDSQRYATRFPIISITDMVRAQNRLISGHLKIKKLYATVGASMGGMQCLAYANEYSEQINKIVSISGCARSHPHSIAMRFCQRQVLMNDPNWNRGFYYDLIPPHVGMKLSRQIATITYRSGPEWEQRFARSRLDPSLKPALCPDFLVETYLDHQGEKFSLEFDPNSLLYISKAMDLFDLGLGNKLKTLEARNQSSILFTKFNNHFQDFDNLGFKNNDNCSLPSEPYKENINSQKDHELTKEESLEDIINGLSGISNHDSLVIGVKSDILFPSFQQKEIADVLKINQQRSNLNDSNIKYVELGEDISMYGHDTFLLDVEHVGGEIKKFLHKI
ncbi:homoserine O-acetyltransferase family protein [Ascoidea rubescens DSM 1968]|uniref:Homoserine O-acetyltransferase n=1 Tax=Ascoidea rubescens DSM 1968 TaxID=1344418 RepID=A0A1D2V8J8_9ASCO|nr:homoserine O-acetyltransferase [Ascoidea rubescens DSM 1968]ODV58021.1 homoserine O-acetyltransferase [Ascoidea rubescens DSM 1968]